MVKRRKKRTSGPLIAWISVGVVVAVVATLVLVKALDGNSKQRTNFPRASVSLFDEATQIPASVFNTVGVSSPVIQVTPAVLIKSPQTPLTINGLPGAFYYGAEYCPFCAATRWGIIAALARFGTFSAPLKLMFSSATDYAPNTPTFTFYKTTYTSKYFTFSPYEVQDRNRDALMSVPADINALVMKYNPSTSFPFMDMGNKVFITQSAFDPAQLQGFNTQNAIAKNLDNPNNYVTQAIISTANYVSAGLCAIAKNPPASVCTSPGVQAAATAMHLTLP